MPFVDQKDFVPTFNTIFYNIITFVNLQLTQILKFSTGKPVIRISDIQNKSGSDLLFLYQKF